MLNVSVSRPVKEKKIVKEGRENGQKSQTHRVVPDKSGEKVPTKEELERSVSRYDLSDIG